ncbi:hypothetical protein GDO81_022893, partial [Engystomops pustulosus]
QTEPLRVVQPAPLSPGAAPHPGEPVHPGEQPVVSCWRVHAAGVGGHAPGAVHTLCQWSLVGLHPHHHLFLHGQPGGLPDRAEDGGAHRVGRRPGGPDQHRVRHHPWRLHHDLLPELPLSDLPADVELHELQAAECVCQEHGGRDCPGAELPLRLPAGVHHERVPPPAQLQPHPDRGLAGHQGLRHRDAP